MPEYLWITDDIFTVDGLLSPDECAEYIAFAESLGFAEAPINSAFGVEMRPDVRNNLRVIHDDAKRAADLWKRLRDYVPARRLHWYAVGANERLRFYRYDVGQQFNWHADGYFERQNGERSHLTCLIYLNEGFEGGETSFHEYEIAMSDKPYKVVPTTGKALVFSHPLSHKGEPVTKGRKYVLRTDIMYSPRM